MNDTERVDAFLGAIVSRSFSPNTVYTYRNVLDALLRQRVPLASMDVSALERFLGRPRTKQRGKDLAPGTVRREIATLRSFWGWCVVRGLLPSDPTRQLNAPKVNNDDPKPISDDLWRRFWALDLDPTLARACGLAYFCGLRRHEVVGLDWSQFVSYPHRRIAGVLRKGGNQLGVPWESCVRLFQQRLPKLGAERMFDFLKGGKGLLCAAWDDDNDGIVVPTQFNKTLRRSLEQAGLPHYTPHQLRHSFVTNLLSVGVPIQKVSRLAGHANIQVTMRYADTGDDPLREYLSDDDYVAPGRVDRWGRP